MEPSDIINLSGNTWVIPGPTNIGVFVSGSDAYLVDSGNDKEAGRKINKIISGKGWNLKGIINTHSNADHIGGNDYLQRNYGCRIWASQAEKAFIESPKIEASFLWGGYPVKGLRNKFFEAKPSSVTDQLAGNGDIIEGLSSFPLPGHFYEMMGVMTTDSVCFLGDCLFGEGIIEKYGIPYVYDVSGFRDSLGKIKTISADHFVPSHGDVTQDVSSLADRNLEVIDSVESSIMKCISSKCGFEDILKAVCDDFSIVLDIPQYALVGNTVRSFLGYLCDIGKVDIFFEDNMLFWMSSR